MASSGKHSPSPTEIAWAAGFYDGEGCTGLHHQQHGYRKYAYLVMQVAQCDPEPLFRLAALFGGRVNGPFEHKDTHHGKWRPYWRWTCERTNAWTALSLMWNFLCVPKRTQAWEKGEQEGRLNPEDRFEFTCPGCAQFVRSECKQKYCSKKCRERWYYHNVTAPKLKEKQRDSQGSV